ncbi:hypothetical protein LSM04_004134 [Trypanosoma melophagium]|uniref:uncharacterized protein n=1 Tax=Trypanosoma melophagium TaxID=715481 RepID=UPI00351A2252|nr:hypothetical protein LSM04_004134 [Trypanosoma melophagium]
MAAMIVLNPDALLARGAGAIRRNRRRSGKILGPAPKKQTLKNVWDMHLWRLLTCFGARPLGAVLGLGWPHFRRDQVLPAVSPFVLLALGPQTFLGQKADADSNWETRKPPPAAAQRCAGGFPSEVGVVLPWGLRKGTGEKEENNYCPFVSCRARGSPDRRRALLRMLPRIKIAQA